MLSFAGFGYKVINSEKLKFCKSIKHSNFSSTFISEIISEIYDWSFKKMIDNSTEIIIHKNKFTDVYDLLNEYNIDPKILFYSKNSNLNLNLGGHLVEGSGDKGYLPDYFMRRFKLMSYGNQVSAFYSPLIEDESDDCHFYLVDRPIQSLVWGLQNMEYEIMNDFDFYTHKVTIPIYHCDYKSYKIRVIDTAKIREEKINTLLNGN